MIGNPPPEPGPAPERPPWEIAEAWEARPAAEPDFLAAPPATPFALLHGRGRFLVLAEDPLLRLADLGPGDLRLHRCGQAAPILPDLVALAAYEHGYSLDPALPPAPPCADPIPGVQLILYRKVQVYDRQTGLLHTARRQGPPPLGGGHALGKGPFAARKVADTETRPSHMAKVQAVREAIARGDVYQVNLARQETWAVQGDLAVLARRLRAEDPAPYSALLAEPAWTLVSASPECFLRFRDGRILARPIKGTAPRDADPARDRALAEGLLASAKDRAELAMIVDLLRNDLARLRALPPVRVEAFPRLESFAHVHHLVAEVGTVLPDRFRFADLLAALFPGGSVTGCPKLAAMRLIRDLEPAPRRVYTGLLGWLRADLAEGDLGLPIRTAWHVDGLLRFGVGGGITWDSDPAAEYAETVHKGRSLVRCLSC